MAGSSLGLIEMAFVFSLALGWGIFELVRLRRPRVPPAAPGKDEGQGS